MSNDLNNRPMDFPPNAPQESSWEFLAFIWRRKLIVVLIAVLGIGLGYLYFLQQVPVYKSTAQILIIKEQMKLPLEGLEFTPGYDTTHETIIRSPLVVEKAALNPEIKDLKVFGGSPNPTGQIISGLTVTGGGGQTGDILTIGFESTSQEDNPKVLAAVIEAYKKFLGDTRSKENEEAITVIRDAKILLDDQIKKATKDYSDFRQTSPLLTSGAESQNVHEARLTKIEEMRSEAVLNNSEIEAQIAALEAALKRGGSREALNLLVGKLSQSSGTPLTAEATKKNETIEETLFPLMLQEQELLEQKNYGPDHPEVRMIRKKIELTRELFLGQQNKSEATKSALTKTADFYEVYLESLREKVQMNRQKIDTLTKLFNEERESSRKLTNDQLTDDNFRFEIGQKKRMFEALISKLEGITLAQNSGGARVEVIQPPTGAWQVRPELKSIMMAAGMLGVLAGLGLAFVIDAADRRFRSPDEIRNDYGLPVLGHIPVIAEAERRKQKRGRREKVEVGKIAQSMAVFHQPKGRTAEAYRGVRTAVFFSNRVSGSKVFQVTSPSPGDGKTTLTCNLAAALANAGKRTILIDADFRRPRVHYMLGIDTEVGMSSVIEGTAELDDAIQETPIENLFVLPCGPRPSNPAELLSTKRFEELIEVLKTKFDVVLFDTPPVLAVTDPLNVAPRVDGLILVLRLTKTARHNGRRALDAIEAVGANILGVVVNGVGKTPGYGSGYGYGGYGYGKYGYGKSYGYGQYGSDSRYGYGYGYGDDKSYYSDDEDSKRTELEQR